MKTTTTSAAAATSVSTTTVTAEPRTPPTLLPETSSGGEFFSPSRNLSCEVDFDYPSGSSSPSSGAYCESISGNFSVTLKTNGTLTQCQQGECIGNAGVGTPVLPYGSAYVVGPFSCLSMMSGVQSALTSGAGFLISRNSVTPLGGAVTVATTTTSS